MKTCTKCGEAKPLEEFSVDRAKPGGLAHRCRACARIAHAEWMIDNRDAVLEKARKKGARRRREAGQRTWAEVVAESQAAKAAPRGTHKTCRVCKVEQLYSEFRTNPKSRDGHRHKCKECYRADSRGWYWNNVEHVADRAVEYRAVHGPDLNIKSWQYRQANPDRILATKRRRRARKLQAGGSHTIAEIRELLASQGGACANPYCRVELTTRNRHLDHLMPLSKGGSDDITNLSWLCAPCNQSKTDKTPGEWARWLERKHAKNAGNRRKDANASC